MAQLRVEVATMIRNGEQVLLTLGIPSMFLVFFSVVDVLPHGERQPVDFLAPGILALATMSSSMVGLGIATGFERSYLVLKRLGATPLGRARLLAAKITSVMIVQLLQFIVLVPVAILLGWRPGGGGLFLAFAGILLGTAAFAGIGLALAGRLRGEINLAAQNGLYLVLLLLGGMVIPADALPGPLQTFSSLLPSGALAGVVRSALGTQSSGIVTGWLVLAGWAVVAPSWRFELFVGGSWSLRLCNAQDPIRAKF